MRGTKTFALYSARISDEHCDLFSKSVKKKIKTDWRELVDFKMRYYDK